MKTGRIFFFIIFLLSLAGNIVFFSFWQKSLQSNNFFSLESKYPLLSKRILQSNYNVDVITNFLPLREEIHKITEPYKDKIAIYFEYMPTGTSIGINEDNEFTAASLLKVPVVMGYFRMKERLGSKEDKTVTLTEKELDNHAGKLYLQGVGYPINLGDAVKLTIQKSDNTASLVLADQLSDADFSYVYEGLDIIPAVKENSPIITAQQYTSVLKALYFASILSREDSQYILDLMTKTDFHNMLPSGIPSGIRVAHKIGLIDEQIYSDCGIVYLPKRPYALCVISQSDSKTAKKRAHDISKAVYEYVAGYKL